MNHFRIKVLIAIIWLVFTISLAGWWWIHAWNQIELASENSARSMLKWEGGSLLLALLGGGAAIFFLIYQERKSYRTLHEFHLAFSHDLKNSMASLQMQVGALRDEYKGTPSPVLLRLDKDSRRLKMKIENSLELSKFKASPLYMEEILLSEILARVRFHEPEIEISLDHDQKVQGDRRALEIAFLNIINNAIKHGGATRIDIEAQTVSKTEVSVCFCDNGTGLVGAADQFTKSTFVSKLYKGSGIGLYLVAQLVGKMGGKISFPDPTENEGFVVALSLQRGRGQ